MPQHSAAAVIDLSEYRRRRHSATQEWTQPRAHVMWVPTAWGYWMPVWSMR